MELNHLRYFFEVAKSGSFTAAARRLRISQSALSKSVALLEDAEGVKLLNRSKRGIELTDVGREVFAKSEAIFQTVVEIENVCRGTKEACEGNLRIGASDHITNYLLLERFRKMQSLHPKVIPSLFSGAPAEIIELMLKNEIEFGLFFTKINSPSITYEPLMSVKMAVVCRPDLLSTEGNSKPNLRSILKRHGLIGSIKAQYQNHPSSPLIDLMGDDPLIVFESNNQETQKRYCVEGGGVAFLAHFMVAKEIASGLLAEVPLPKPVVLNLHLAKKKSSPLSLSAKNLIALIKDLAKSSPAIDD